MADQYKCICGQYLIKMGNQSTTPVAVYKQMQFPPSQGQNYSIQCNLCKNIIPKNAPFWHCGEEENEHHLHGFDSCELCIYSIPNQKSKVKSLTNPYNTTTSHKSHNEKRSIIDLNLNNEVQTICILNMNPTESPITSDKLISHYPSDKNYIISDVDAELLILVEFKQAVDLRSIKLYALKNENNESPVSSPPKLVHIYKSEHNNLTFEDMDSMTPDLSIACSARALNKGKTIHLAKMKKTKTALKFRKIRFVTLFIQSNQNNTETTYINGVGFIGQPNEHEKHKILVQEETLATTTLNQSVNKARWGAKEQSEQKQMEIKHGHFREHGAAEKQSLDNTTSHAHELDSWVSKSSIHNELIQFNECTASHCDHLSRVVYALTQYRHFIECNLESYSENTSVNINEILSSANDEKACSEHVQLMNDFHHLMKKHRTDFEQTYHTLITACNNGKECDLKLCVPLRRNHRNRHRLRPARIEKNKLYFNHDHPQDISLQQILDKIHCYYFHTFDIGYRHTVKDRNEILQRAQKRPHIDSKSDADDYVTLNGAVCELARDIRSRKRSYENIEGLEEVGKHAQKFVSATDDSYGIGLQYKFGVRFFYWPYYKDKVAMIDPALSHQQLLVPDSEGNLLYQLYIEPKFSNIKDELINNSISTISEHQWNVLLHKAKTHAWTEKIRGMLSNVKNAHEIYNLTKGQALSVHHLIAFMVYCNFDTLQREFSKTTRMEDDDDKKTDVNIADKNHDIGDSITKLIEKHSNYAHLARLLRECIECFVRYIHPDQGNMDACVRKYYHGIRKQSEFPSMVVRINTPISTSAAYEVAMGFALPNGMVLQMDPDQNWFRRSLYDGMNCGIDAFECFFISDFANEQEILFFGGMGYFVFKNIQTVTGDDYRLWIAALITLSRFFFGSRLNYHPDLQYELENDDEISTKFKKSKRMCHKLCVRLILHELHTHFPEHQGYYPLQSITDYAQSLVSNHFQNIIYIEFFTDEFFSTRHDELLIELCNALFVDDYGWLKLNILMTLFPALRFIMVTKEMGNDTFCEHDVIYESVLSVLAHHTSKLLLQSICIIIPSKREVVEKAKAMIGVFKARFKKLNWNIYVFSDLVNPKASSYIHMEPVFCDRVMTFLRETYQTNRIPERAQLIAKK
eukprot:61421_1